MEDGDTQLHMYMYMYMYMYIYVYVYVHVYVYVFVYVLAGYIVIQDDLLAGVIFGGFACGKIDGFYIGDFVPRAIEHAQIETKWQILYW